MRTLWNYGELGTSSNIFLSYDYSLYAPIYLEWTSCLISFASDQSTCKERVESDKMKNSCPPLDSNPQPWDLKSAALPSELVGLVNAVYEGCSEIIETVFVF